METVEDIMYLRKMCKDGGLAYRNTESDQTAEDH